MVPLKEREGGPPVFEAHEKRGEGKREKKKGRRETASVRSELKILNHVFAKATVKLDARNDYRFTEQISRTNIRGNRWQKRNRNGQNVPYVGVSIH